MIKTFNSKKDGPSLVVIAGVHGDEICGLKAFDVVLPKFSPKIGRITFIIGNPKAVAVCQREFEGNLNRMFRSDKDMSSSEKRTYEYRRARKLMPILAEADAVLDIHSSTTEQTVPFIICEKQSYDCVSYLPADVVVSNIDTLHPTGTDAFTNQSGGLGICIECGNHNNPEATDIAVTAINNFLAYFEVVDTKNLTQGQKQEFLQADWIYKNKGTFVLARNFVEFEKLKKGEVIGLDMGKKIIAPYDGVILFPHNCTKPDTEAFLFGKKM